VINGQQQKGDLLDPLHHLLARDADPMALAKNPFQRVISEVVVKAAQQQVNRQPQPQPALRHQSRGQGRNADRLGRAGAGMRVFGPNRLLAHELGGHVFVFGGDFLPDFASGCLTPAANLVSGFQEDALHFQLHRREGRPALAEFPLAFFLVRQGQVGFQHVPADGRGPLVMFLLVPRHRPQLLLLLRVKVVGLEAEQLPFQFGDISARLRQQLLLLDQRLRLLRKLCSRLGHFLLKPTGVLQQLHRRAGKLPPQLRPALHACSASRKSRRNG